MFGTTTDCCKTTTAELLCTHILSPKVTTALNQKYIKVVILIHSTKDIVSHKIIHTRKTTNCLNMNNFVGCGQINQQLYEQENISNFSFVDIQYTIDVLLNRY